MQSRDDDATNKQRVQQEKRTGNLFHHYCICNVQYWAPVTVENEGLWGFPTLLKYHNPSGACYWVGGGGGRSKIKISVNRTFSRYLPSHRDVSETFGLRWKHGSLFDHGWLGRFQVHWKTTSPSLQNKKKTSTRVTPELRRFNDSLRNNGAE